MVVRFEDIPDSLFDDNVADPLAPAPRVAAPKRAASPVAPAPAPVSAADTSIDDLLSSPMTVPSAPASLAAPPAPIAPKISQDDRAQMAQGVDDLFDSPIAPAPISKPISPPKPPALNLVDLDSEVLDSIQARASQSVRPSIIKSIAPTPTSSKTPLSEIAEAIVAGSKITAGAKRRGGKNAFEPCPEGQYRNPLTNRCKKMTSADQAGLSSLATRKDASQFKPCDPNQVRYYRTQQTPHGTNHCRKIETLAQDPAILPHLQYLQQLYSRELQGELIETLPSTSSSSAQVTSEARELDSKRKPCKPGYTRYFKTERTPQGNNRCRKNENIPSEHKAYLAELYRRELAGEPIQTTAHSPINTSSPELLDKIAAISPSTAKTLSTPTTASAPGTDSSIFLASEPAPLSPKVKSPGILDTLASIFVPKPKVPSPVSEKKGRFTLERSESPERSEQGTQASKSAASTASIASQTSSSASRSYGTQVSSAPMESQASQTSPIAAELPESLAFGTQTSPVAVQLPSFPTPPSTTSHDSQTQTDSDTGTVSTVSSNASLLLPPAIPTSAPPRAKKYKPCPPGQVRSRVTKHCRKLSTARKQSAADKKAAALAAKRRRARSRSRSKSPCPQGSRRNRQTGRCRKISKAKK